MENVKATAQILTLFCFQFVAIEHCSVTADYLRQLGDTT